LLKGIQAYVYQQLLQFKARCKFVQYFADEPDKLGKNSAWPLTLKLNISSAVSQRRRWEQAWWCERDGWRSGELYDALVYERP